MARDGIAGDFDYEAGGIGYAAQRRTDPRVASNAHAALGAAQTVVNVGAGAGSYEPTVRDVTAVEPSAAMRAQRPRHLSVAVDAAAEHLPFPDKSFDAAIATITIHQWSDVDQGLRELRRVSRGPVVIVTFDGDALELLWLAEYAPELIAAERRRYPGVDRIERVLGGVEHRAGDPDTDRLRRRLHRSLLRAFGDVSRSRCSPVPVRVGIHPTTERRVEFDRRSVRSGPPAPRDAVEARRARPELVEPRIREVPVGAAPLPLFGLACCIPTIDVRSVVCRSQG